MGVSPRAGFSQSQLKKSYYTLSKQYHPDKNPSPEAHEMFQKVKLGKQL
jgi:DnaJ-class molecular chaperone